MRRMDMPIVSGETSSSGGSFKKNPYIYVALPAGKTKGKVINKLYVGLFAPSLWPIYSQEHPLLHSGGVPDVGTFYWRFNGHFVPVRKSDGTHRQAFVLCAPQQNKFQVEELKYGPLFKDERCRYCEETKAWWERFDDEWNKTVSGDRRDYSIEQFQHVVAANTNLRQIKEAATRWRSTPRYIFQVFDVSKALKERNMDKGEELALQLYFAPKKIYEGLSDLYTSGVHFFEADSPSSIVVVKDTTGPFADYRVQNLGPLSITDETKAYVGDDANQVPVMASDADAEDNGDDGAVRLVVLSYDEQRILSGLEGPPGSGSSLDTEAKNFNPDKLEEPSTPVPSISSVAVEAPKAPQAPIVPMAAPVQAPVAPAIAIGRPAAMPKVSVAVPVVSSTQEVVPSGRRKGSKPW